LNRDEARVLWAARPRSDHPDHVAAPFCQPERARRGPRDRDEGAWEKARDHFHRAYQLIPAPTLALMEARALVRLGRLVEALDVYELAANRVVDDTNEPFRRASADARTEVEQLRSRVPRLNIELPGDGRVQVRVDATIIDELALHAPLTLDPGTHLLEWQADGEPKIWSTVALREGDRRVVRLVLPPDDGSRAAAAVHRHRTALWSALAVGSVGVVIGVGAGALATHASTAECAGATCAVESDSQASGAWRSVSTAGYALSLAGLATSGLLFATLPRAPASARVGAFLSAGGPGVQLTGSF
jgi:hypothetical protein